MALISCPECTSQVSSLAISCPQCGCPISPPIARESGVATVGVTAPKFPDGINFNFFEDASGWFAPNNMSGKVLDGSTAYGAHPGATVSIFRKVEGIWVIGLESQVVAIHYAQVASVNFLPKIKSEEKKKSVVGRAVLGGIVLGPLGAVVGGISGVGTKTNFFDGFVVNYWDRKRSLYAVLAVEGKDASVFYSHILEGALPFAGLHS